jgi:hypothetical protein
MVGEAEAHRDERHARCASGVSIRDRIADEGGTATSGAGDCLDERHRIGLADRQRVAVADGAESSVNRAL